MNLKEIKEMIKLMNENQLTEIEVERDGLKIKLKKGAGGIEKAFITEEVKSSRPTISTPETAPPAEKTEKTRQIKAPMVGVFYRAPSPEASPFVEAGGEVAPGDVVCIIEAMKLMNEIKAENRARIVEVLVENGEPVEFGQPLFTIEPL